MPKPSLWSRAKTASSILAGRSPSKSSHRSFAAAMQSRLSADWVTAATSADNAIRGDLRLIIDRARGLERDNDYARGFFGDVELNVVGSNRFDLKLKTGEWGKSKKGPVWRPDREADKMIVEAWNEWGRKGTCTACGQYSWRDVRRLAARATARDGNFLARKVVSENRFGFALQCWEIDHLDLNKFAMLPNGNEVRFGVETDDMKRPVAYHLCVRHPGDLSGARGSTKTVRVSADGVYHIFLPDRVEQTVGVPWIISAITRLRQLGAFEEAAVIAARVGAMQTGFFKKSGDGIGEWTGDQDEAGAVMDAQPGQFTELPEGWDLASWNPEYPNTDYNPFRKGVLQGIATGLGTSYISLGNDLESVNYSSARVGIYDEREMWKSLQMFFTEHFYEPVFRDWLETALLNGALPGLPISKIEKYNKPIFKGRRWPYIDPVKERKAQREALDMGTTSRQRIAEEAGEELEDIIAENAADIELAAASGIVFEAGDVPAPGAEPGAAEGVDEIERMKTVFDSMGVAVRGGFLTPSPDLEKFARETTGLGAMTPEVTADWKKSENVRTPLTIIQPGAPIPEPAKVPVAADPPAE